MSNAGQVREALLSAINRGEVITQIRGTAFTGNGHQDAARVGKPGHDHPGG